MRPALPLRIISFALGIVPAAASLAAAHTQPNLILINADDVGYGDLGVYGGELVPTPSLDRLAQRGIQATAAYVASPVCGPSRYALMTGAYPQRFGVQTNKDAFSNEPGDRVPREHLLLPELLRRAGYNTGLVGKWNLKSDARIWFDEVYSLMDWGAEYFPDKEGRYGGVWQRWPYDKPGRDYGWGPVREGDEYLTDRLGRESIEFIEKHREDPFFLYLAPNAAHSPLQAKETHRAAVSHISSEPLRLYAAMLLSLDENVGRIMDTLDRLELTENTLVVFASDNGPSRGYNVGWPDHWDRVMLGSAGPFSGRKATFREGGVRVPLILQWPAALPSGSIYGKRVSMMDIYPTFAAAAGIAVEEGTRLDGVNLFPFLRGERNDTPHTRLYWYQPGHGAMRLNDWKLIVSDSAKTPSLYHLKEDPAESQDVAQQYPDVRDRMMTEWQSFVKVLPPPFSEQYAKARKAYELELKRPPQAIHEPQLDR